MGNYNAPPNLIGGNLTVEGLATFNDTVTAENGIYVNGTLRHNGSFLSFYNTASTLKPTVSGAKGANAALASLMTALVALGLVTDSTTA